MEKNPRCPRCMSVKQRLTVCPTGFVHYARTDCAQCGYFLRWEPRPGHQAQTHAKPKPQKRGKNRSNRPLLGTPSRWVGRKVMPAPEPWHRDVPPWEGDYEFVSPTMGRFQDAPQLVLEPGIEHAGCSPWRPPIELRTELGLSS